jgi:hypothetical protein
MFVLHQTPAEINRLHLRLIFTNSLLQCITGYKQNAKLHSSTLVKKLIVVNSAKPPMKCRF